MADVFDVGNEMRGVSTGRFERFWTRDLWRMGVCVSKGLCKGLEAEADICTACH